LYLDFKSSPDASDSKTSTLKKKIRDLEFNPERYVDELSLTKKEEIQIRELVEKKTKLIKKLKRSLRRSKNERFTKRSKL